MEGRRAIVFNNLPVPIACLADLLELQDDKTLSLCHNFKTVIIPCVILSIGDDRLGILVDELLDEQEIVLKQAGKILKRVRNTSGSTILGTGEVCLVLNPYDLIRSARKKEALSMPSQSIQETEDRKSILVAEDSISVRTQMKRILEGAGYEVAVAVDGLDAYAKLGDGSFDALVSDIIMPNMSGLELTEKIRQNKKYRELPIILVTSLASAEDKQKGLEAGANAYLIKPTFDQRGFLEILGRLI
jgi:two-component system chemotaxis sensor kinase CheA